MTKTLSNTDNQLPGNVRVHGDTSMWICIAKAWSVEEGWMKSTKVMNLPNGALVQVSTQQYDQVAEALQFIPGVNWAGGWSFDLA